MQRNSPRFFRWSVGTDLALQCGLLLAVLLFGTELLPVVHGQMNKEEAAENAESEYPRAPPHGNEPSGLTGNVGHPKSHRNSAYLPVPLSHTEMPDLHHPSPTGSSENPTQLRLLQQKLLDRQIEVNRLNAFIFSLEQNNQALINNMAALQQLYDAEREDSTSEAKLTIYSQRIDSLEYEAALKDEQIRNLSTMLEKFAKTDQSSTNTQLFSLIDVVIDHNSKLKHDYNACIKGNIVLQLERNQRRLEDWNSRIEILRQHTSFSNQVMELLQTFVRTAQSSSLKELLPQIQLQNTNIINHMNRLDAEIGRSKSESDAHLMDLLAAQEGLRSMRAEISSSFSKLPVTESELQNSDEPSRLNIKNTTHRLRQEYESKLQALNTTLIQLKSEKAQYEDAVREKDDALRELNTKWAAEKVEYDALRKAQQAGHDVGSPDVAELKSARRAQNYVLVGIVVGLVLPLAAAVAVLVFFLFRYHRKPTLPAQSGVPLIVVKSGDDLTGDMFS